MGADAAEGRITDTDIELYKRRIGYAITSLFTGMDPHVRVASVDSFRHFAEGYGDDNPLFCDEDYGAAGPHGCAIAPPLYLGTIGTPRGPKLPAEVRKATAGALTGVHAYHSGTEYEFYRPIVPGDRLFTANFLTDVEDKPSQYGGGRSVILHYRQVWWKADVEGDDRVVAACHNWFVNTERKASKEAGKYMDIPEPAYTDEDIARIDAAYQAQIRRGAEPLARGDVKVGTTLPPMVKGPLNVTDVISFHVGWGWGGYGVRALDLGHRFRRARPGFFAKNRYGAFDVVQRVHWETDLPKEVGAPRPYDYGYMRSCWMTHLLTNWMGDAGWLLRYRDHIGRFNYLGDTTWLDGEVTGTDDGQGAVTIALRAANQREEETMTGEAVVLLPEHDGAPVSLPPVSRFALELVERAEADE